MLNGGLVKRRSRVPLSPGRSQSPAAESKALRARPWAASLQCQSRQRRVLVCGHSAARGLRRGRGLAGAAGPRRRPPGRRPGLLPMRRSGAGAGRRQLRHLRRLRHPPRLPLPAGGLRFKLTDPVGGSWGGRPWRPGALCSLTVDWTRTRSGPGMAGWLCKAVLGGSFGAQEATRMKVEKALPLSFLSTPHFLWGEGEELREPPAGWHFCPFSSEQVQKPLLGREWPPA